MKKMLLIIIVILSLLCVFLVSMFLYNELFKSPINPQTIMISNPTYNNDSISFDVINANSGIYIAGYDYSVESGVLSIKFYGSISSINAIDSDRITIQESGIVDIKVIE